METTWNERLKMVMDEKSVTVMELARATEAAHTSVMGWIGSGSVKVSGDIRSTHLLKACDLLQVNAHWIMFGRAPKDAAADWPFTTSREAIDRLEAVDRQLIDRILFFLVEHLGGRLVAKSP